MASMIEECFEEMERCFDVHDMDGAEDCMKRYLQRARDDGDWGSQLTILNEQIGFYRKMQKFDNCMEAIGSALNIVDSYGLDQSGAGATTWLNSATAFRAFKYYDRAYEYFLKTLDLYNKTMEPDSYEFPSLYNNLAVVLTDMGRYEEAEKYYNMALEILPRRPNCEPEMASTYVSMAHMYHGMEEEDPKNREKMEESLARAWDILTHDEELRDNYFAYVSDTSSKSFRALGAVEQADVLKQRAEDFYAKQQKLREEE